MLEGGATYFSMMGGFAEFQERQGEEEAEEKAKMRRENGSGAGAADAFGAASPRNK